VVVKSCWPAFESPDVCAMAVPAHAAKTAAPMARSTTSSFARNNPALPQSDASEAPMHDGMRAARAPWERFWSSEVRLSIRLTS
jgi:hypothetical protein